MKINAYPKEDLPARYSAEVFVFEGYFNRSCYYFTDKEIVARQRFSLQDNRLRPGTEVHRCS